MRNEGRRRLLLESQHFGGFIEIFFAALIASDSEAAIDRRTRGDSVCFG
jgi:hypothetical protein